MKSWSFLNFILPVLLSGFVVRAVLAQEGSPKAEAYSLLGKPLYPLTLAPEEKAKLDSNLASAQAEYEKNPADPERIIWLGRRLAYLWRYRDAIEVYSEGLVLHPNYAKLYRHRGHRYITIREFDKAIVDLENAAKLIQGVPDEIEPDGAPNRYNIPTSTSHSNIWYHLGLAYYLKGYGVGNWYFYNGQMEKAKQIFAKVIEGKYWAAFGYIAAEAELKRVQKNKN